MSELVAIRPVVRADHDQWRALWDGYNAFYGRRGQTALAEAITRSTWERFFTPSESVHALVAERSGAAVGIAHYLFHRSTTRLANVCYLQDLFTAGRERGRGVGRALIEAVCRAAEAAGSSRVYWQTQGENDTARRLYDKVAKHSGFIVYAQELPAAASAPSEPSNGSVARTVPASIDSERLTLRQFAADDWRALHEHYCDPECTRFTFGRALSEAESWRAMATMVGHWQLRGYGPYAVVEKASAAVIGTVGLWYPNDWPEPEIKWALLRKAWGQGYAQEAARAVQRVAVAHLGQPPISLIAVDNIASSKVALGVGARIERTIEFRGNPCHVYRHPRDVGGGGVQHFPSRSPHA